MSITDTTTKQDVSLVCDLYELTMAQGFWQQGMCQARASFTISFRENPFRGGYALCCGTAQIPELIENFRFNDDAIEYLASLQAPAGGKLFNPDFLDYLKNFSADVDVYAAQEGEVVFPREPIVRIEGPIIACQLLETALLNLINFQTLVATKAARVVEAADGRSVADFGLRRAQGPDGALSVARASYIGGVCSTSNVLAGKLYGIPVSGTHAHSWVMSFSDELSAFRAFAATSPNNCTLLVDTYNVAQGIKNAITVAKEMEQQGYKLRAIRIDSGDLADLSKYARQAFDEAGLPYVQISVSNDLDEYTIQSLLAQGAPIDMFGVGTKLATCDMQPSLGGVYKLCAIKHADSDTYTPTMKLSALPYKRTIPGLQQVLRFSDAQGIIAGDVIVEETLSNCDVCSGVDVSDSETHYDFSSCTSRELLQKIVEKGHACSCMPTLEESRAYAAKNLSCVAKATRRFLNPQKYPVCLEKNLDRLRIKLARSYNERA